MTDTVAFPQDRTCPFQPAPGYRPLAEQRPLSRVTIYGGREAWAVTGDALTRQLLSDPRISSNRNDPAWPATSAAAAAMATMEFSDAQKKVIKLLSALVAADGPEHLARRKVVEAGFTDKLVDAARPRIQEVVDRHLDAMIEQGAPADLVPAFTFPVPLIALYEALGIPREDQDSFKQKSGSLFGPGAGEALDELTAYLTTLIEKRQPGESLLDALVADGVAHDEILQLLLTVLVSGHHTTSSSLALGTFTLLQHPERLAELRADPSQLPAAVDELSRLVAVPDGIQRLATEDIEVEGTTIHEGDAVIFLVSLINRDEETHSRPDVLDWHRPTVRDHLSYGSGPHECVGADLARVIMEIAFRTLFERLPGLRLAVPAEEVAVKPGESFQGLAKLPVTW